MHTCFSDTINVDPTITGTMITRLGSILFTPDDIYSFNGGLSGFKERTAFVRTNVPSISSNLNYGMLQSLDDSDLSFILFYPVLDASQQEAILHNMCSRLGRMFVPYGAIDVAFLVIPNKENNGKSNVGFVKDAPIVFLKTTKQAWQLVLA